MTENPGFANVILPVPLHKLFTYSIPEDLISDVSPGKRVIVQFGKRKMYSAIVKEVHSEKPFEYETKEILSVVDNAPVIPKHLLEFWDWMASYYMCTPGDVYKASLPAGLRLESETRVFENPGVQADPSSLTPKEEIIFQVIRDKKVTTISQVESLTKEKNILPVVNSLIRKQLILAEESLRETYKPKIEKYITLHESIDSQGTLESKFISLSKSKKRLELLMLYLQLAGKIKLPESRGVVAIKKLKETKEFSAHAMNALVKSRVFQVEEIVGNRLDLSPVEIGSAKGLNNEQKTAFEEIKENFKTKNVVLLHGVTGSGKTEIYIRLIGEQLKKKRQVLYLLPEIAITTQIINRLRHVFGKKVGIYHSRFPDSERVEIWNKLLRDDEDSYRVILGVLSAIFLPFSRLGLVIIDEEHENTYKQQDPAPRYHARDAGIYLASKMQAKCLLGTATPAVESYHNARTGKYGLVELNDRFGNIEMPGISVANMQEARKKRQMKSLFTPALLEAIKTTTENGEQVILFQNRRGFAPYLECDSCGWIPYCRNCDVSLPYHKSGNQLTCHYCGFSTGIFTICKACENPALSTRGFGTEKIEDELKIFFPHLKAVRMDLDSTRSRKAYEKIIDEVESGRANILVGTQMISKGLDFDNVGLVGILNADNLLNFPDFRAHERSYQLMAQVSGRAGRKNKKGNVIIQTGNPEHPVIKMVVKNDYKGLFSLQVSERKKYNYPPFFRLIEITLKHKNQLLLETASLELAKNLTAIFNTRVLGPQSPPIPKMQNQYLKRILLKLEKPLNISKSKELIRNTIHNLLAKENYRNIQIIADVDPM